MNIQEIENKIRKYQEEGKKLFTTSSFQTHSIVLLHILSRIDKNIPVYFIHTGYHFPETLTFRDEVAEKFKGCAEFVKWPAAKTQSVIQSVKSLENLSDVSKLAAALTV